ncbi:MAG: hypothetical protein KGZ30_01390 [Anaplasmataceae bacterium]|nr:hypothetical protein [Anaplasmataceae bacterium]
MEIESQNKPKIISKHSTVHTRRTMMFAELSRLLDFSIGENTDFKNLFEENVIAKQTKHNVNDTNRLLKKLYLLDDSEPMFKVFHHFWNLSVANEKPLLALLLAITRDFLLAESIDTVINISSDNRVDVSVIEQCIESNHPKSYTDITRHSIAKNIASSWKQTGHITGKMKNIRTQVTPGYYAVAYALFLGFVSGLRGDFLFKTKWTKVLDCSENELRSLAQEAAKRELLLFQYAGNVTVVNFKSLIQKLHLHGITD